MKYIIPLFFLIPTVAFAQNVKAIVPCGYEGMPDCQACHLVVLADNVVRFLVELGAVLGTLAIVIAGIMLFTSGANPAKRAKAKSMMTNVVIGFLIMLGSWLVVDTIIKTFTDESKFGMWNEVQCLNSTQQSANRSSESSDEEKPAITPVQENDSKKEDVDIEDIPRVQGQRNI